MGLDPSYTTSSPNLAGRARCWCRGSGRPALRRPTLPPGYLPRPAGVPPSADTGTDKHSPIFPLGFVDVTISASANFAALVFKQVLDPLPLAAQLHFKVIVHCHSLRGRGAGSGGRGTGVGTGEAPAAAAPGNPPALHPAAAAPARLMRQEEEAPRERRGHPGGRRGRGRPGGWGDGEVPPGEGEQRDEGWGWGAASLPLSPRAPGEPAPTRSCCAFCSRYGERRGGRGGLSSSYTRTHASPSLTHTLTLTHSLSLPYTQTERQRRTTAGTSSERGGREGTRGTRPRLSQKRREGSGCLRASLQPAPRRGSRLVGARTSKTR